jgi:hypothetical protein
MLIESPKRCFNFLFHLCGPAYCSLFSSA